MHRSLCLALLLALLFSGCERSDRKRSAQPASAEPVAEKKVVIRRNTQQPARDLLPPEKLPLPVMPGATLVHTFYDPGVDDEPEEYEFEMSTSKSMEETAAYYKRVLKKRKLQVEHYEAEKDKDLLVDLHASDDETVDVSILIQKVEDETAIVVTWQNLK